MSIHKPTKAQLTTAIVTAVLVVEYLLTQFPDPTFRFWASLAVGIVGIVGNGYGVWRIPNAVKPDADPYALQAEASKLMSQANATQVSR